MAEIVINKKNTHHLHSVTIGDRTMAFMQNLKLDEGAKQSITDEACDILSKCIEPGIQDSITNIAVGYVQSGKTLSFTTLTTLAADNGYRIIIYLTGTKTNLQKQTCERLMTDLDVNNNTDYHLFDLSDDGDYNIDLLSSKIPGFICETEILLLFPILKHYKHIQRLAEIFRNPTIANCIKNQGVIIIDDEADQSSFNTYAKTNSKKEDWDDDDFSKTYASILELKKSLPSHSYIQYTATPQAAFLIDNNDILSPTYHTVLTPGEGYCGGKFFFKNKKYKFIKTIPPEEVYHYKDNHLKSMPKTLEQALMEFIISVAIVVLIEKRKPFLSMMVHIDGRRDTNEKFNKWICSKIDLWIKSLRNTRDQRMMKESFNPAYLEVTKYMDNPPTFEETMEKLSCALLLTGTHLVQGGNNSEGINWKSWKGNILVGAEMLNRGFTIENLSMSYLPRSSKSKSNADTIEQRCRFFGYKANYYDVCRVYLSSKNTIEYSQYVDHEESLRNGLKECQSLKDFSERPNSMMLAQNMNPTRTNILSAKLVRSKMSGWRQLVSLDYIDENKIVFESLLSEICQDFVNCEDYNNIIRNHRYARMSIDKFIFYLKNIRFMDVPNITRKIATIQYLNYLKENKGIDYVYIYEMAYQTSDETLRLRGITNDGKPLNLQAGRSQNNDSYPGDKFFKQEDSLSIQIHHIRLDKPLHPLNRKDLYNMSMYYPSELETSFVGTNVDDGDE